jgi:hypothetical protein
VGFFILVDGWFCLILLFEWTTGFVTKVDFVPILPQLLCAL